MNVLTWTISTFLDFADCNTRLFIVKVFNYERKSPDIVGVEIHVIFGKIYDIANTYRE